ncbi:universal stress protein [soil metagenome]
MKVLLPVDGSEYTKRMLDYVGSHDELLGKSHEYFFFTAVPSIPPHASRFVDKATIDGHYADEAAKVLQPVAALAEANGMKATTHHSHGHAADCIAAFAEQHGIDLIVMGTHGHSAFGSLAMGSVATGVLARCKVPVLLVR